MRRQSVEFQPVSESEQEAVLNENRVALAESALQDISEVKKRLLSDIAFLRDACESTQKTIESNKQEIFLSGNKLIEAQNAVQKEKQNVDDRIECKRAVEQEIEEVKNQLAEVKDEAEAELTAARKNYELVIREAEKEVEVLNGEKDMLNSEIGDLKNLLENLSTAGTVERAKSEKLAKESDVLATRIDSHNSTISILKEETLNQKDIINKKNLEIADLDAVLVNKKEQVVAFDAAIAKKEDEYKAVESKAFTILQKQEALNQKEAFIKSQYERSGISWVE